LCDMPDCYVRDLEKGCFIHTKRRFCFKLLNKR
jgi:hypothetical protein